MIPWASPSPQSKWHHDRFSCFRTDDRSVSILYNGRPFTSKLPLVMGHLDPILYMVPWAILSPQPKRYLDRFSRFAQMTAECPYTLQWDAPLKIAPTHGGSEPTSNTWSLGRHRSPQPKRHLDRFSRFCRAH